MFDICTYVKFNLSKRAMSQEIQVESVHPMHHWTGPRTILSSRRMRKEVKIGIARNEGLLKEALGINIRKKQGMMIDD